MGSTRRNILTTGAAATAMAATPPLFSQNAPKRPFRRPCIKEGMFAFILNRVAPPFRFCSSRAEA